MKAGFQGEATVTVSDLSPEVERIWRTGFERKRVEFDREFKRQEIFDRWLTVIVLCVFVVLLAVAVIPIIFS